MKSIEGKIIILVPLLNSKFGMKEMIAEDKNIVSWKLIKIKQAGNKATEESLCGYYSCF